ncbi:hypothetical protein ACFSSA_14370 [Luteolibacter algae]|uniref:D-ribose pyranase n=1 Tax=Luteolibacter algae TaxID=454151 RepID=A0ABW5DD71_9BACT
MPKSLFIAAICVFSFFLSPGAFCKDWEQVLEERLPEYGHRNWIIIADAAYPKQSAPGIETIYTGAGQVEVLEKVLKAVDTAKHVRPMVMLDAELDSVSEKNAGGVDAYRNELRRIFGERAPKVMAHDDIIRKLDDGAKMFSILLLKTDMTIPYTSVFIELDCGYWSAAKEQELRKNFPTP